LGSETDGSHTDVSKINTTGSTPGNTPHAESNTATGNETSKQGSQAGSQDFEADARAAGAVPAVPGWMGGDCGNDAERARDSVRVPVLHGIAPRFGSGAGIQASTPGAVDQDAPGRGIG